MTWILIENWNIEWNSFTFFIKKQLGNLSIEADVKIDPKMIVNKFRCEKIIGFEIIYGSVDRQIIGYNIVHSHKTQ